MHLFADWPGTLTTSAPAVRTSRFHRHFSCFLHTHLVPFILLVTITILALYRAVCLPKKARIPHLIGAARTFHGIRRKSQRSTSRLGRSCNCIAQLILTRLRRIYMKWYARNESFKAFLWFDADSLANASLEHLSLSLDRKLVCPHPRHPRPTLLPRDFLLSATKPETPRRRMRIRARSSPFGIRWRTSRKCLWGRYRKAIH